MSKTLDFESLEKGSPLEGLAIPALTRVTLARFAGAVDDYNPMHLDDKVASAAGKGSVFAPASLVMAYVGRMVEGWLRGAALRRFEIRVTKLVWPGDVLTCGGTVVDKRKEGGQHIIDADVWAHNQRNDTVAWGVISAAVPATKGGTLSAAEAAVGVVYHPHRGGKAAGKKAPARGK